LIFFCCCCNGILGVAEVDLTLLRIFESPPVRGRKKATLELGAKMKKRLFLINWPIIGYFSVIHLKKTSFMADI